MTLVAACLALGMVAAPSAVAAEGGPTAKAAGAKSAKAKKSATSTTARARRAAQNRRRLPSANPQRLRRRLVKAEESLRGSGKAIRFLVDLSKSNKNGVDFLLAAAPQLVNGLVQLRDGVLTMRGVLETEIGPGLLRLKSALENDVAPALTDIGNFIGATEYGIGQVIVMEAGPAPNPQEGSFLTTPDLPDTVQQAQTSQQFVAQQAGALAVAYGVRSGENDGTGASKPAAHCKVTVTNEAGQTETTLPNGALGGVPFQPVNTKSALTSTDPANQAFPFGLKTVGPDADQTTLFTSSIMVAAGDTYTVGLACVDTTPDPDDPEA